MWENKFLLLKTSSLWHLLRQPQPAKSEREKLQPAASVDTLGGISVFSPHAVWGGESACSPQGLDSRARTSSRVKTVLENHGFQTFCAVTHNKKQKKKDRHYDPTHTPRYIERSWSKSLGNKMHSFYTWYTFDVSYSIVVHAGYEPLTISSLMCYKVQFEKHSLAYSIIMLPSSQ